ncbi:hypothetical protein JCM19275_254 [Nonlabens ulvanivorans]|uniref:Uncharacterized protein n=1 Tax=Nonlabens ulvanivorans TaxID=906888 RepID=A0A090WNG6_NONUL|nr:hypothetical protein JCM19275_254 [Nonlabens ulvanivorans]
MKSLIHMQLKYRKKLNQFFLLCKASIYFGGAFFYAFAKA